MWGPLECTVPLLFHVIQLPSWTISVWCLPDWWELGRPKAGNRSAFSVSLCSLIWGGKGRTAPNLGGSFSVCHTNRPCSLQPLGTVRVAERSGPAGTVAAFGLSSRHKNNKLTLILAEFHVSEDYLAYSRVSLRQWSIRNFQGWFIQLLLSKHQAPGSLPAHPL